MTEKRTALTYICPDDVLSRTVGEELVLVHLDTELYYSLNSSGASIWAALQTGSDFDGIVETLVKRGAKADQAGDDALQLLDELVGLGLLTTA